jgi:hypothetical protein
MRHDKVADDAYARHQGITAAELGGWGVIYRPATSRLWGPEAKRRMIQRHLDELRNTTTDRTVES